MAFDWLNQQEVQNRRQAAIADGVKPKDIDEYIAQNQQAYASQGFQTEASKGGTWKQLYKKYGNALGLSDLKNFKQAAVAYNSLSPHGPLKESWIKKLIGVESISPKNESQPVSMDDL